MPALECLAMDVLSDGAWRSPRQNSILSRSSAAMLTCGAAAGLLGLSSPNAALAQDAAATDLPAIVVVDPTKKPKREAAKRVAPARVASARGAGRTGQPAQEAPVAGAGEAPPAQAAL